MEQPSPAIKYCETQKLIVFLIEAARAQQIIKRMRYVYDIGNWHAEARAFVEI